MWMEKPIAGSWASEVNPAELSKWTSLLGVQSKESQEGEEEEPSLEKISKIPGSQPKDKITQNRMTWSLIWIPIWKLRGMDLGEVGQMAG